MKSFAAAGSALLALAAANAPHAASAQTSPAKIALPDAGLGALGTEALSEQAVAAARARSEASWPRVAGGIVGQIEDDWTFAASDDDAKLNTMYPSVKAALSIEFPSSMGVYSTLAMEPVEPPEGDTYFQNIGIYVEEIYASWNVTGWTAQFGKFNTNFGAAWYVAPGIYGADFADDYALFETLGAAVSAPFTAFGQDQRVMLTGFTADSSAMSNSLITDRGNVKRADGGPANANTPSLAATLNGGLAEDVTYNVGLRWMQAGHLDPADQYGAVVGAVWSPDFAWGATKVMGEAAYFQNYDATEDSAVYVTAGGAWGTDGWTVSAVYSLRDFENHSTDHLATTTVQYDITDNVAAGVAYRYGRESGVTSHTAGFVLSAKFGGSFGLSRD